MKTEILVVGAGPAGSAAARAIAATGREVVLVDKAEFPREKVCGGCLSGRALGALEEAGLGDLPASLGARPLSRVLIASASRRALVPLPAGRAVSRFALDAALIRAAEEAGVRFLPGSPARLVSVERDGLDARVGGDRIRARVAVVADGLGGGFLGGDERWRPVVAPGSRIGAGCRVKAPAGGYPDGTVHMAVGRNGYTGLVRLPDGTLDVGAALDPSAVRERGGTAALATEMIREAGLPPVPGLADSHWRGTPPLTRHRPRLAGERIFVIGDSAGYVEPFTGEGIGWALSAGLAVAPIAARGSHAWDDRLPALWERTYRRLIGSRQGALRTIRLLLRRPRLTGLVMAALGSAPALASPVLTRIHAPVPARKGRAG